MSEVTLVLIGYFIGIIVSFILFRPKKSYNDGYIQAQRLYGDWNKGFEAGFDAAIKSMAKIAHNWISIREQEGDEQWLNQKLET